ALETSSENFFQLQERQAALMRLRDAVDQDLKLLIDATKQAQTESFDLGDIQEEINKAFSFMKMAQDQADSLKVELTAPPRMTLLEDTIVSRWENRKKQIQLTGLMAFLAFLCTGALVTWWELRAKRINSMDEVANMGLRLIGTLPALPDRKRRALI